MLAAFAVVGPFIGQVIAARLWASIRGLGVPTLVELFDGGRPFTDNG